VLMSIDHTRSAATNSAHCIWPATMSSLQGACEPFHPRHIDLAMSCCMACVQCCTQHAAELLLRGQLPDMADIG